MLSRSPRHHITNCTQARIAKVVADDEAAALNRGARNKKGASSASSIVWPHNALTTPKFLEELRLQGFMTASIKVGEGTQLVRFVHAFGIWGLVQLVLSAAVQVHDGLHRHAVHVHMDCVGMQSMLSWTAF